MAKYRVLAGLDYPPAKRAEAGDVVSDLPAKSIKWLREAGLIEPADRSSSQADDETDTAAPAGDTEEA